MKARVAVPEPSFVDALPFWLSLALLPIAALAVFWGSWWLLLIPASTWALFSGLDAALGRYTGNLSPETPESALYWHQMITLVWVPIQCLLLFGFLAYVPGAPHLSTIEKIAAFFGVGVLTGTIGITYAHELMHRPGRLERWLGDILMAMTLYGHFRSEHLLVHHTYVATPKDTVTARFAEGFPRFFMRVLPASFKSAWRAEINRLARRDLPWWDKANPFWTYFGLQVNFLVTAFVIGGWVGLGLFVYQAFIAVWQLELVNYVEHYGLTRRHLGAGRYEPVRVHHSWNATQKASNWLLINLQRHSDHHTKPARPFPLLQSGEAATTPELPYGYPVMTTMAMWPPLWRKVMNPRVRAWRKKFYPDITDWVPYNRAQNPLPR